MKRLKGKTKGLVKQICRLAVDIESIRAHAIMAKKVINEADDHLKEGNGQGYDLCMAYADLRLDWLIEECDKYVGRGNS